MTGAILASSYTTAITNLKTVLITLGSAIGAVMLVYGGIKFAMYMFQVAKLMTHQHDIDDALTDSVLAALVADDIYYFETNEAGAPVIRFRNNDESKKSYIECMEAANRGTSGFYYNFIYEKFIEYEGENGVVYVTTYTGNSGVKTTSSGRVGTVKTPGGEVVTQTSAYAKVSFDIKSMLTGQYIRKYRDEYCVLEIN